MIRILFVDDEQFLLDGLQNLLRKQRKVWEMHFVISGEAALEALAARSFDIIVTDMRMPGMDGAALLERVIVAHPGVIRMVLSGQADEEQIRRVLPVTHQFLSKPCDTETLTAAIEQALAARAAVADPAVRAAVGRFAALPSPQGIYDELVRVAADLRAASGDFAAVIGRDPAMSAKVLQIVNSSFFGLPQHLSSIAQAVAYLGVESIKSLAVMAHVFGVGDAAGMPKCVSPERLQRRSLLAAALARRVVRDSGYAEQAFAGGLLHDLGHLVLGLAMPERYCGAQAEAARRKVPFESVEFELLGVRHAPVGGYLLGAWGIPPGVVEAVTVHHDETPSRGAHRHVIDAVRLAARVSAAVAEGSTAAGNTADPALAALGVPEDQYEVVRETIAATLGDAVPA